MCFEGDECVGEMGCGPVSFFERVDVLLILDGVKGLLGEL